MKDVKPLTINRKIFTNRIKNYLETHSAKDTEILFGKMGSKDDISHLYGLADQAFHTGENCHLFARYLDPEDSIQEIVIKLLQVIDEGRLKGDCYYFYLRRTAYNVLHDQLRTLFKTQPLHEAWEAQEKENFLRSCEDTEAKFWEEIEELDELSRAGEVEENGN